jgi:hypothetical protein
MGDVEKPEGGDQPTPGEVSEGIRHLTHGEEMFGAIREGDSNRAEELLLEQFNTFDETDQPINFAEKDAKGRTLLGYSIENDQIEIAKILIEYGADTHGENLPEELRIFATAVQEAKRTLKDFVKKVSADGERAFLVVPESKKVGEESAKVAAEYRRIVGHTVNLMGGKFSQSNTGDYWLKA